jgi:hypothetical protein
MAEPVSPSATRRIVLDLPPHRHDWDARSAPDGTRWVFRTSHRGATTNPHAYFQRGFYSRNAATCTGTFTDTVVVGTVPDTLMSVVALTIALLAWRYVAGVVTVKCAE